MITIGKATRRRHLCRGASINCRFNSSIASPMLALMVVSILTSACGERKLPGKRITFSGFESATRAKVLSAAEQRISLPKPRQTSSWQQELFSTLHTAPHFDIAPKWERLFTLNSGAKRTRAQPLQATPIVSATHLFSLSAKGVVSAFDIASGKRDWRRKLKIGKEKGFGGGLALAEIGEKAGGRDGGGRLIVTTGAGKVFALAAEDGEILWKYSFPFPLRSAPTVSEQYILTLTPNHRTLALSLDGERLWQHQSPNQTATQLTIAPAAAIVGRYAIIGYGDGTIFALNLANGQALWKVNISARRNDALADLLDISTPPVVAAGVVYASSASGKTVALDLASGAILWRISLAATSWLALFDNSLFVVDSNNILSALNIKDGKVIWEQQLNANVKKGKQAKKGTKANKNKSVFWNGPLLADGKLIVNSSNGVIVTLNAQDGEILSQQKFGSKFTASPIAVGKKIFLLDSKGKIQVFE